MNIILKFKNSDYKDTSYLTEFHQEALTNARVGDYINIYHYNSGYDFDEYRKIESIFYNGNVKMINLADS